MPLVFSDYIHSGMFADVWEASDEVHPRLAVKLIYPHMADVGGALAHARALAQTQHPNLVVVHYVDTAQHPETGERCECVVMEYLEGESLDEYEPHKQLTTENAARIIRGMCAGVSHLHSAELIHGDLHPGNVLITDGSVKLLDMAVRGASATASTAPMAIRVRRDVEDLVKLVRLVLSRHGDGLVLVSELVDRVGLDVSIPELLEQAEMLLRLRPDTSNIAISAEPYIDSPSFFHGDRICQAFPGARRLIEFNSPVEAIYRLQLLLRNPLGFRCSTGQTQFPIWGWRGGESWPVTSFAITGDTTCLLGHVEMSIRRVAAYHAEYYRSFCYIECAPMEPSGAYPGHDFNTEEQVSSFGYASEEYALFEGRPISRSAFDDDAAVIDDVVIPLNGRAQLRTRFLTPYNVIISAHRSCFTDDRSDGGLRVLLNNILVGSSSISELATFSERLRKPAHGEF